jgi:hypothetical protein
VFHPHDVTVLHAVAVSVTVQVVVSVMVEGAEVTVFQAVMLLVTVHVVVSVTVDGGCAAGHVGDWEGGGGGGGGGAAPHPLACRLTWKHLACPKLGLM